MTNLAGPAVRAAAGVNLWVPDRREFECPGRSDSIVAFCDMCRMPQCLVSRLPARRWRTEVHAGSSDEEHVLWCHHGDRCSHGAVAAAVRLGRELSHPSLRISVSMQQPSHEQLLGPWQSTHCEPHSWHCASFQSMPFP